MSLISCGPVLRRVKDFLPKIKEAEKALQKELQGKSPSELDIENVEDAGPYIEMVRLKLVLWLRTGLVSHLWGNKMTVNCCLLSLGLYVNVHLLKGFQGGGADIPGCL